MGAEGNKHRKRDSGGLLGAGNKPPRFRYGSVHPDRAPGRAAGGKSFPIPLGKVYRQQTEYYGACTSVRVWYEGGAEIEFGLVEPSWIALPLDEGTRRVLSDGYCVLYDRAGHFDNPLLPQPNKLPEGR